MSRWRAFAARVRESVARRRIERDLDAELRTHLELLTEEYLRRGLDPAEASRAARLDLGGLEQTKELVRDRRGFRAFETLIQDVRYAIRQLVHAPGFSLTAVTTLALGIGANAAIFSLVDGIMLRPLPYPDPGRLVAVWEVSRDSGQRIVVAPANFVDYEKRARAFSAMAAVELAGRNLADAGTPERLTGEQITASYFDVLGIVPALGRPFLPADNIDGHPPVVIITDGLRQRRFGGTPDIVGRRITLDGLAHEIVGVMPRGFRAVFDARSAQRVDILLPTVFSAELLANRRDHEVDVIARLKRGVTVEAARADMAAVSASLARDFPDAAEVRTALAPLGADQAQTVRPLLLVLLGGVGFVLLIACVNVASLLVVRSIARQHEIAVRFALGATRRRVMSELLTQSVVLAIAGAIAGLILADWTKDTLLALAPPTLPNIDLVTLDWRVLTFAGALAIATTALFGVLPAWQVSRTRPTEALRTSERSRVSRWTLRSRSVLLVAEIALSMLLLVGAGLMARSMIAINDVDLGFEPEGVLAANISLPRDRYPTPESRLAFFEDLSARVAALPNVENVAFANRLPLRGNWISGLVVEPFAGAPIASAAGFQSVSPGYFPVLRMKLIKGRLLAASDRAGAASVAVVNEAFARAVVGGADPLGRRISRGPKLPWITIVGVVSDVRRGGRLAPVEPQVYLAATQTALYPLPLSDLAVRARGDARTLALDLKSAVWSIDRNQPVTNVRTLDEVLSLGLAQRRFQTFLFGLFAVLALALALVGVYGVVSYAVAQRTAEIGLRMALGADAGAVMRWLLRQSLLLITGGAALGLAAAYSLSTFVRTLLFGTSPTDPATYALAAAVLTLAAMMAAYLATRRATRVDPVIALK